MLDAANIDVKAFDESYYRRYCGGSLEPVLTALRIAHEEKVWVEVTNLIVPGGNDAPRMIADLCQWHMAHLGPDVPMHFSRFFPMYRMQDAAPTPLGTLQNAARIARDAGIRYVYVGNIATPSGEDTICPKCGRTLVQRQGFIVVRNDIRDGRCPYCGAPLGFDWKMGIGIISSFAAREVFASTMSTAITSGSGDEGIQIGQKGAGPDATGAHAERTARRFIRRC